MFGCALVAPQSPEIPPFPTYHNSPPWVGGSSVTHPADRLDSLRKRKAEVVMNCIHFVESSVDAFLGSVLGYDHKAVPFDYLDCPPTSMAAVELNLDIVLHCFTDLFLPTSAVSQQLLIPVRDAAYSRFLDPLIDELKAAPRHGGFLEDLYHLQEMKAREGTVLHDDPSTKKSRGPDDVVPVTGQVASRLQRLENELRTVISHWSRR